MKKVKVVKTAYEAFDGKVFEDPAKCKEYEDANSREKKLERVRQIYAELGIMKHGGKTVSLAGFQRRRDEAKREFLQACRGKRRNTKGFAENVSRAACRYISTDTWFNDRLAQFKARVYELKCLRTELKGGKVSV